MTARQSGAPSLVLFRLWKIGTRLAAGTDLRDDDGQLILHYTVVELPVSEVHNGGVGFAKDEFGNFVYRPDHWVQAGWRTMREIPSEWREHNARVEALAAKREAERNPNGMTTIDAIRALSDELRRERRNEGEPHGDRGQVAGEAPNGDRKAARKAGG